MKRAVYCLLQFVKGVSFLQSDRDLIILSVSRLDPPANQLVYIPNPRSPAILTQLAGKTLNGQPTGPPRPKHPHPPPPPRLNLSPPP